MIASGRDDAEVHVGQEGRGDQHAVEHVVERVADQDQRAAGLLAGGVVRVIVVVAVVRVRVGDRVLVAVVVVTVAPEQEFFEDEEERDAGDQGDADLVDADRCRRQ